MPTGALSSFIEFCPLCVRKPIGVNYKYKKAELPQGWLLLPKIFNGLLFRSTTSVWNRRI